MRARSTLDWSQSKIFLVVFLLTPTGHSRIPITTVYGSKRVFPRKVGPFGVSMINK